MDKFKDWFACRMAEASSRGGIGMIVSGCIMVYHNPENEAGYTLIIGGIYAFCTKGGRGKINAEGEVHVS